MALVFDIELVVGDLTTMAVDAVVNAANSTLLGGGGVDGALHRAAGPQLLEECRGIVARQGGCETGDVVITGSGELLARYVIHTVGPVWRAQVADRLDPLLASCYSRSLELAAAHGLGSVAFPNISTGVYGYPKERAARIAITAVRSFGRRETSIRTVIFVCFNDENAVLYRRFLDAASAAES
jgi:O-acetyl-ADP-ribose deacetylase